jgi:hypothetical protein
MLVRDGRRSCSEARDLAKSQLEAISAKLDELTALKNEVDPERGTAGAAF